MKNSFYTISNLLSLIRLFLAIPFWFLLDGIKEGDSPLFLMLIVLLAIISDFLDGYFARKFNQISEMGKILDPLADKICVASITFKLYLIGFISPL
ncbi:MAG: CDP-alcohol phosphatidyltransferase family protein, partial [Ignavibacteriaceae bacterium]|nr:CDP-alcohol phosphatidyltransferase family protein [Ignavibacteriaceae bacterium]